MLRKYNRIEYLLQKYVYFYIAQKYFIKDFILIEKIELYVETATTSDEDIILKNILIFLENITGQKAMGIGEFRYVGTNKIFFFSGKVTIRKKSMYTFINFLVTSCLPLYYRRNGRIIDEIKNNMYTLSIDDFAVFYNCKLLNLTGVLRIKIYGQFLEDILNALKLRI